MKDYYEVLGVAKDATQNDIKSAYRKLAKQYHPDVNKEDHTAEEKFKEVATAYETLSNVELRTSYDNGGSSENASRFSTGYDPFGGFNPFNPFGNKPQQNSDLEMVIQISAQESVNSFFRTVGYEKTVFCKNCNGNGGLGNPTTCQHCNGRKFVTSASYFGNNSFVQETPCPICHAKGTFYPDICTVCNGFGLTKDREQIVINFKHPVAGKRHIYENMGNEENPNYKRGNLYILFQLIPLEDYEFQGYDCIYKAKVNPVLAMIGGNIKVPTLEGAEIDYNVPAMCEVNHTEKIGQYGLFTNDTENRAGLWVNISYEIPNNINEEQKSILKSYLDALNTEENKL